jgi:hypothetical protein
MTNDENTRQIGVREIVVGRLNDAHPLAQQALTRLDELSFSLDGFRASLDELRAELERPGVDQEKLRQLAAAPREAIAVLQEGLVRCYVEINEPVRWANERLGTLNSAFMHLRVEQSMLEDRVGQHE